MLKLKTFLRAHLIKLLYPMQKIFFLLIICFSSAFSMDKKNGKGALPDDPSLVAQTLCKKYYSLALAQQEEKPIPEKFKNMGYMELAWDESRLNGIKSEIADPELYIRAQVISWAIQEHKTWYLAHLNE